MDFIERLFGVSPDGGNGTIELLVLAACVLAVGFAAWRFLYRSSTETKDR